MSTSSIAEAPAAAPTPQVTIVGRSMQILHDGARVIVPLEVVSRLRERLEEVESAAEQVLSAREITDGLRAAADYLDAHPELTIVASIEVSRVHGRYVGSPDLVDEVATCLDVEAETANVGTEHIKHEAVRKFGPVSLTASAFSSRETEAVSA